MKKNALYILIALVAICSCSEEREVVTPGNNHLGELGLSAIMHGYEVSNDCDDNFTVRAEESPMKIATRSNLSIENPSVAGSKLLFTWQAGDQLAVFSTLEGGKNKQIYRLNNEDAGKPAANFIAEDFEIKDKYQYFSFTPTTSITDQTNKYEIAMDYSGQVQIGDNSTAHLGKYNYMASYQQPKDQSIGFDFRNLSTPIQFRIAVDQEAYFDRFEIQRADGKTIKYRRLIDLTESKGQEGAVANTLTADTYSPYSEPDPNEADDGHGYVLKLQRETSPGVYVDGIHAVACSDPKNEPEKLLNLWLMFPRTAELVDKILICKLSGKDMSNNDITYYFSIKGYEFTEKYKYFNKKGLAGTNLNVNLKVKKNWFVGNTQTRATAGDPGVDDKLEEPKYIYLYTCKDGKLVDKIEINTGSENDSDDNLDWKGWKSSDDEWTYDNTFSINVDEPTTDYHIYAIASYTPVTLSSSFAVNSTTEDKIADVTYSITGANDSEKMTNLKNLYSADYRILKGGSMVVPLDLYHTCAKLDVQWNNKTASALTGNVSVNNVPTSELMMFTPTANTSTSNLWSPSTAITHGTEWNGRTVFYVPQLASQKYNISVGAPSDPATKDDITFTAPADEMPTGTTICAKTAWFKANITINPAP